MEVKRDLRVLSPETADAVGHPVGSKLWADRHDERLLFGTFLYLLQCLAKPLKRGDHCREQHLPLRTDQHPPILSQEERDAKVRLQRTDLVAHGGLRDVQLAGGVGEAQVAGDCLKGLEEIQRWKFLQGRHEFSSSVG